MTADTRYDECPGSFGNYHCNCSDCAWSIGGCHCSCWPALECCVCEQSGSVEGESHG